jgi:ATP synthase protein I
MSDPQHPPSGEQPAQVTTQDSTQGASEGSSQGPSLDELGGRISKARHGAGLDKSAEELGELERGAGADLSAAWRISIEIVVALVVCTAIGWALDYWFGTKPWFMLLFLFLGGAAGINNAVRTALRMDAQAAEVMQRKAQTKASTAKKE